jgi:hypothetical protein
MPRHFVFVGRADSARSRADFRRAARRFGRLLHLPVIGKNQMRAVGKMQASRDVDAGFCQRVQFRHQRRRIHNHSRPDHRMLARAQNSAGDQLQDETVSVEDDGVAGVVPTRASRDVIERRGKVVHHLALALHRPTARPPPRIDFIGKLLLEVTL